MAPNHPDVQVRYATRCDSSNQCDLMFLSKFIFVAATHSTLLPRAVAGRGCFLELQTPRSVLDAKLALEVVVVDSPRRSFVRLRMRF